MQLVLLAAVLAMALELELALAELPEVAALLLVAVDVLLVIVFDRILGSPFSLLPLASEVFVRRVVSGVAATSLMVWVGAVLAELMVCAGDNDSGSCCGFGFASQAGVGVSMMPRETPSNGITTVPGIPDVTSSPFHPFWRQAPAFSTTRAELAPAAGGDAP